MKSPVVSTTIFGAISVAQDANGFIPLPTRTKHTLQLPAIGKVLCTQNPVNSTPELFATLKIV